MFDKNNIKNLGSLPKASKLANKELSQNFLQNPDGKAKVHRHILDFLNSFVDFDILEIGPGLGDLTGALIQFLDSSNQTKLDLWEMDTRFCQFLETDFLPNFSAQTISRIKVFNLDALGQIGFLISQNLQNKSFADSKIFIKNGFNLTKFQNLGNSNLSDKTLKTTQKTKTLNTFDILDLTTKRVALDNFVNNNFFSKPKILVSNLPFATGSRMLVDWILLSPKNPWIVILQKEVVQKITHIENVNLLWLWVNTFFTTKKQMDLPPGYFVPPPKVVSGMISAKPIDQEQFRLRFDFKNKLETETDFLMTGDFWQFWSDFSLDILKSTDQGMFYRLYLLDLYRDITSFPRKVLAFNLRQRWTKENLEIFYTKSKLNQKIRINKENIWYIIYLIIYFEHSLVETL